MMQVCKLPRERIRTEACCVKLCTLCLPLWGQRCELRVKIVNNSVLCLDSWFLRLKKIDASLCFA